MKHTISFLLFTILILSTMNSQVFAITSSQKTYEIQDLFTIPALTIDSVNVTTEKPEQGMTISAQIKIFNNESIPFNNLVSVIITLTDVTKSFHPSASDIITVVNETIPSLPAKTKTLHIVEFTADAGQYSVTSYLSINNTKIPTTVFISTLEVIEAPIGDISTLGLSVLLITGVVILATLIPSIIDKFRKKNKRYK